MKLPIIAVSTLAFTLAFGTGTALAEEQGKEMQQAQGETGQQMSGKQGARKRMRAEEIVGMEVVNRKGIHLGDVNGVVRRAKDETAYAVISIGGFLDMGDQEIAVAIDQLRLKDDAVVLPDDIDSKVMIKGLPGWDDADLEELGESEEVQIERADFAAFESDDKTKKDR
ncbi:PRC-barrel domain-containing protein [uncultured Thiohalocapsa sp.]|uniref:PRC-barrel domain-containing protein n=1 Tax=uncultured Thiohalocapsa sp. TaxID=768990 RepID=UPI0025EF843B|nr:PRC-barrel domain-containing protein [uncultured Thiohalocapsa sp.]